MSHVHQGKTELLKRIRRVKGQMESVEKALTNGADCADVLQQIAACRGAVNGLLKEVLEDHIRHHVNFKSKARDFGAEELIAIVRSYLK
jgi:DNA-binding FrmR family transcriptional regulator